MFNQAGLLSLTASATNPDLTKNGWTNFFRGLANDAVQGPSVAKYLVNTKDFGSVCVVSDNSDYGIGLAQQITEGLGDAANEDCAAEVKTGDKDFSAAVQIISGADADAVFYAGYYAEAAPFVQGLRDGGVDIPFVSADGTNDPQFVSQAGAASKGAILSCPCGPAPDDFAATYEETNGQAPGVYSVEGYDLATIMLTGIASGVTDRAGLIDYVANYPVRAWPAPTSGTTRASSPRRSSGSTRSSSPTTTGAPPRRPRPARGPVGGAPVVTTTSYPRERTRERHARSC